MQLQVQLPVPFLSFPHQEFKYFSIQINQEHCELLIEIFNTLDDVMETHVTFEKMYVTIEEQEDKREQASKSYDDTLDRKRYMKDRPQNITILSSFQMKKVRIVLHA